MNNQKEELKPCLIYRSLTTGQPDNCNPADSSVEGLGEFHVMPNGSEFYMLVWTGKWATYSNFMYSTNPEAEINECNGEKLTYMKVKVYCCDSVIKTEPC